MCYYESDYDVDSHRHVECDEYESIVRQKENYTECAEFLINQFYNEKSTIDVEMIDNMFQELASYFEIDFPVKKLINLMRVA